MVADARTISFARSVNVSGRNGISRIRTPRSRRRVRCCDAWDTPECVPRIAEVVSRCSLFVAGTALRAARLDAIHIPPRLHRTTVLPRRKVDRKVSGLVNRFNDSFIYKLNAFSDWRRTIILNNDLTGILCMLLFSIIFIYRPIKRKMSVCLCVSLFLIHGHSFFSGYGPHLARRILIRSGCSRAKKRRSRSASRPYSAANLWPIVDISLAGRKTSFVKKFGTSGRTEPRP